MSERGPDIREILDELEPSEQDRLRAVHELLLQAGPPPELSPQLAAPPAPEAAKILAFPRRYRATAIAAAAAAAAVLFGVGYEIGHGRGADPDFTVAMTGASGARAALAVFPVDSAGNWPMKLKVRGLHPLPGTERYELWLTRGGELVQPCGTFAVSGAVTEVALNAPYRLRAFDGWVVVAEGNREPVLRTETV